MISRRSCLGLFLLLLAAAPVFPQDTFEGVQRIVAIGDVHGDYGGLVAMLRIAKLVDANLAWQGGAAHLVILGDFIDRGPDSRKVMDLLIELGPQAQIAGGRVHALIGNHEAMNIYGDLRYVSPEDFDSFRTPDSKRLIDDYRHQSARDREAYGTSPQYASDPGTSLPLGWVEHRLGFLPSGKYGKWLRQQNVVIRINDFLFVHGGISPKYATLTRKEVNERIRAELTDFSKLRNGLAVDPDGPLWYRRLAGSDTDKRLAAHVDRVLETQAVRHLAIGHTPAPVILPRFGGKVILTDIGLSFVNAAPALLLVEGSRCYTVYRDGRVELPLNGAPVLPYLIEAQRLDPANSRLRALIRKGGRL